MYYAFELYPELPPIKVNNFERPRGKVHCFKTVEERSHFIANRDNVSCISRREAEMLSPVGGKKFSLYIKKFKD